MTSELIKGHKIVWYEFTDTRSADHLRRYLANYIVIVSDAYGAYPAVEKELNGKMKVAFYWMHLRRYFANAVLVTDLDALKSNEEIFTLIDNVLSESAVPISRQELQVHADLFSICVSGHKQIRRLKGHRTCDLADITLQSVLKRRIRPCSLKTVITRRENDSNGFFIPQLFK